MMRGIDAVGVEPHSPGAEAEAPHGAREKSGLIPNFH